MTGFLQDVFYSVQILRRNKGIMLAAVVCIGLGVGATTTVFSVVNGILFTPLDYEEPDRLVMIFSDAPTMNIRDHSSDGRAIEIWQQQTDAFSELAAYMWQAGKLDVKGTRQHIEGFMVSPEFFEVLGIRPMIGRTLLPEETSVQRYPVVILGHQCWSDYFGEDESLVGETIEIDDRVLTVVGVMPPGLTFLPSRAGRTSGSYGPNTPVDYWTPLTLPLKLPGNRWDVVARLNPSGSLDRAQHSLNIVKTEMAKTIPQIQLVQWNVKPLRQVLFGDVAVILFLIFGGAIFVLLIAGANVASLLSVSGLMRRKEIAIRSALGSGRLRVMRQLVIESMLVSFIGCAAGLLIASWSIPFMLQIAPDTLPRLDSVKLDWTVVLFALGATALMGLVLGATAGFQAFQFNLVDALKAGGSGPMTPSRGQRRALGALVVLEIGLAITLLIGAGLMTQTLRNLSGVDPGYDPENLLTLRIEKGDADVGVLQPRLLERVRGSSDVIAASTVFGLPMGNKSNMGFHLWGATEGTTLGEDAFIGETRYIGPGYFDAMDVSLVAGREFTEGDDADAPDVAIVNTTLAERCWPGENPLGKRIVQDLGNRPYEIVGVIPNIKNTSLDSGTEMELYFPLLQGDQKSFHLVARTASEPRNSLAAIRDTILEIDESAIVRQIHTMDEIIDQSIADRRFATTLLTGFSVTAFVLAMIGIFGVMSYSVSQRKHEIGIRAALGGDWKAIAKLILSHALTLILIGEALGIVAAPLLAHWLRSELYGVGTLHIPTFVLAALTVGCVATLASSVPIARALSINPAEALRT